MADGVLPERVAAAQGEVVVDGAALVEEAHGVAPLAAEAAALVVGADGAVLLPLGGEVLRSSRVDGTYSALGVYACACA